MNMGRFFRKLVLPLGIILAAIAIAAALLWSKPAAQSLPKQESAVNVDAMRIDLQPLQPGLRLYGQIESPNYAKISAALEADVERLYVAEGSRFAANQLLLELDPRDARLALQQQQAQLQDIEAQIELEQTRHKANLELLEKDEVVRKLAQRTYQRARSLQQESLGSKSSQEEALRTLLQAQQTALNRREQVESHAARLQQLKAKQAQARARLQASKLNLQRSRVVSDYAGVISKLHVAEGERVRPGSQLLDMYPTNNLEVRAQIPQRALPVINQALAQGLPLPAHARLDGQGLQLRLDRVAAAVDSGQAGVDGFFRIESPHNLQTGRIMELLLKLPTVEDAFSLPSEALYGTDLIYKIDDQQRMQAVEVERLGEQLSVTGEHYVVLRSPHVRSGDIIVISKFANAMPGLKVLVRD